MARKQLHDVDTPILIDVDLDNEEHRHALARMGGETIVVVRIRQGGKHTNVFLSARVSGDDRAGSQHGAHVELEVARSNGATVRTAHARPCFVTSED